jgi:hypothetical protein
MLSGATSAPGIVPTTHTAITIAWAAMLTVALDTTGAPLA